MAKNFGKNYLYPNTVDKNTWFYVSETGKTIEFVRQIRDKNGDYLLSDIFKVRLNKIKKAVEKTTNKRK